MQARGLALSPELVAGVAASLLAHGMLFWGRPFQRPAQALVDSGAVAVELTLVPSAPSVAAPPPESTPEPVETFASASDAATDPMVPEPQPDAHPEAEPEPESVPDMMPGVSAVEQDGAPEPDQGALTEATTLAQCRPVYPRISRRRGEEGTVVLSVEVGADGTGSLVRILESSGYPRLDNAAQEALAKARFSPAIRLGRPVSSTLVQTFEFRLTDE